MSLDDELAACRCPLHSELKRLTHVLHMYRLHPDYEYTTTTSGRKQSTTNPPEGEGWEPNGEGHDSWERFEYHEEEYWRRRKA